MPSSSRSRSRDRATSPRRIENRPRSRRHRHRYRREIQNQSPNPTQENAVESSSSVSAPPESESFNLGLENTNSSDFQIPTTSYSYTSTCRELSSGTYESYELLFKPYGHDEILELRSALDLEKDEKNELEENYERVLKENENLKRQICQLECLRSSRTEESDLSEEEHDYHYQCQHEVSYLKNKEELKKKKQELNRQNAILSDLKEKIDEAFASLL